MIDVRLESLGLKVTLGLVKQSLSSVLEKGSWNNLDHNPKYRQDTVASEKSHGVTDNALQSEFGGNTCEQKQ